MTLDPKNVDSKSMHLMLELSDNVKNYQVEVKNYEVVNVFEQIKGDTGWRIQSLSYLPMRVQLAVFNEISKS